MIAIGTSLGHFRIVEAIGSGASGIVYRAHDTKLGREVALKVLSAGIADHPARLERFHREARSLATLNHPSIASIHGIEEDGGVHFLVLELIPGRTLAEALASGPIPIAESLSIARQIAGALEAAHARGIVHRDLKPANIRLTPEGRVKVLDFGLAKALDDRLGPPLLDSDPTATTAAVTRSHPQPAAAALTHDGDVLGTPLYLSPEQARGTAIDARADLWAFGCILYESLSGEPPFAGGSIADVIAAVLEHEPDLDRLPAATPPGIRDLIARCLQKSPERRPENARAIADLLDAALGSRRGGGAAPSPAPLRFTQVTFAPGIEGSPVWSPDGAEILYTREVQGVRHLFRQPWSGGTARQATRGEHDEIMPAWSPDGRSIAFVRARDPNRLLEPGDVFGSYDAPADIWILDLESGREEKRIERAYHPAFSPDGTRIAVDAAWAGPNRIWILDHNGRNPRQATTDTSEAVTHIRPRWSPDGERIVFQNIERTKLDIRVVRLRDGAMRWVTNDTLADFAPCWTPDGRFILFSSAYRGGGINLWRAPVGPEGHPTGAPEPLTTGAGQDVDAAVSPDGTRFAFAVLRQNADLWKLPVDPGTGHATGTPSLLIGGAREESRGAWSPDGMRIAFNADRTGEMNLWIHEVADGSERPLTRGPGGDYQANWSPDGSTLAFFSARDGNVNIWAVDVGSGALRQLTRGGSVDVNPFYSPDGAWIAFQSDRDGRLEVWVMRADGSEPRQITRIGVGGHFLRWTPDARGVIFRCPALKRLMRVPIDGGDPEPLPEMQGGAHISLSPDATRVIDVVAHKVLWVSPLREGVGSPERVFEFPEPEARIDYPVWSPHGRWVLFDRFQPQGGDIWVAVAEG